MEIFNEYIQKIGDPNQQKRMEELLSWVNMNFPNLEPVVKWNQPMFSDHGTYIIGFSISKQHIAVAPEYAGINHFADAIEKVEYDHTKELFRIRWDQSVNYQLLYQIIEFNILDKANSSTFWR
ncbi:MAG: iron chaperone [Clostridiaceae bacterium]